MNLVRQKGRAPAFTLVELLVLIIILFLLAVLMLPALAGTRSNTKAAQCLNNLRRLTGAWQMYAGDNADRVMANPTWVAGVMDWSVSPDNTNSAKLIDPTQSPVARYVQAADSFKCPADNYAPASLLALGYSRVRSVSLNAALGGSPPLNQQIAGRTYFAVRKMTELNKPGPANTIVLLDEHPDSINDGTFFLSEGLQPSSAQWIDLPASYHDRGAGISFADGSAMLRRWQDNRTVIPVRYFTLTLGPAPNSVDYIWLNDRMPYR